MGLHFRSETVCDLLHTKNAGSGLSGLAQPLPLGMVRTLLSGIER